MEITSQEGLITLSVENPIWNHVFTVAPLVIIGTKEPQGGYDLAPKHLAMPLSWDNYFGFVCTAAHATYHNIKREKAFTVSYPRPTQVLITSLAASQRDEDSSKPLLDALTVFAAEKIDGVFVSDSYFFLECILDRIIEDFGENCLIAGRIIAAHVQKDSLRQSDKDDSDLIQESPLLAYVDWGRFARIKQTYTFPFTKNFKR